VRVLFKQLIIKMMKLAVLAFALFAAVVAEPEAEASPEAYYGHAGYGLGYRGYGYGAGYYGRGYGYGYPYHGYGYGHGYYRGKRSADADPALFYGAYSPYAYGYAPYAYAPLRVASGSSFQHVSTPAATYGVHQLHKREAEAEADASPDAYYGYAGYGYGYPYHGYGYGRSYGYRSGYYGGYGRYGGYGYGGYGYGK